MVLFPYSLFWHNHTDTYTDPKTQTHIHTHTHTHTPPHILTQPHTLTHRQLCTHVVKRTCRPYTTLIEWIRCFPWIQTLPISSADSHIHSHTLTCTNKTHTYTHKHTLTQSHTNKCMYSERQKVQENCITKTKRRTTNKRK